MMTTGDLMDFNYLRHLAELGTDYLHPHSKIATQILITQLDLQDGQRILELGCGTGATLVQVAQQKQVQLDGVDILPEMLRVAQTRVRLTGLNSRIRIQQVQPGNELPFDAATFDRVYVESVLGIQTANGVCQMLDEIYRVLKPGGLFLANEAIWKPGLSQEKVNAVNEGCIRDFGVRQALAEAWDITDWIAAMQKAGFQPMAHEKLKLLKANYVLPIPQRTFANQMSTLLNQLLLWKAMVSWRQQQQKKRYQTLLEQHTQDGQHIEARLFVMSKVKG